MSHGITDYIGKTNFEEEGCIDGLVVIPAVKCFISELIMRK